MYHLRADVPRRLQGDALGVSRLRREQVPVQARRRDGGPDASETPVADLRETYETAKRGYETILEKYAEEEGQDATEDETAGNDAE
ncbi:uncharacterized protein domain protein [Halorubrum sp. AJ67]|nr:uncharacterized protein domain protein [Halorubrum sp. AJ67]